MRPLHSLFEGWHADKGSLPSMPSRGAVAHWADPDHLSETNAIIIAMAATSLFRGLNERQTVADRLARMIESDETPVERF